MITWLYEYGDWLFFACGVLVFLWLVIVGDDDPAT